MINPIMLTEGTELNRLHGVGYNDDLRCRVLKAKKKIEDNGECINYSVAPNSVTVKPFSITQRTPDHGC